MKTTKTASTVSALALATLLATGSAWAHSNHDHSHLPVGWTFDSKVVNKIYKNLEQGQMKVGLSSLEQDMLQQYGIEEGNTFNTRIGNKMFQVRRTNSGIRIEKSTMAHADGLKKIMPVREQANLVRSTYRAGHPGHDHQHLDMAWVFNRAIEDKIHKRMKNDSTAKVIGLNSKERAILERYGIKVGNAFHTQIGNVTYTVKRTTTGLNVLNYGESHTVASTSGMNHGVQ